MEKLVVVAAIIVIVAVVVAAVKYLAKELSFLVAAPVKGVKGTHKGIKGLKVKRLQAKRVKKLRKYAQEKLIANAMIQPDVVAKVGDIDAKISKLSK